MMIMDTLNQILEILPQSILIISSNQIIITVVIGLITLFLIWFCLKISDQFQSSVSEPQDIEPTKETVESDVCPYPNCVRCHQKNEILNKALQRLEKYKEENKQRPNLLTEVEIQLKKKRYKYMNNLQKPVVFYLPSLPFKNIAEKIETIKIREFKSMPWFKVEDILNEYEHLKNDPNCSFKENSVDSGSWKIYHLVDQGKETSNAKFCVKTMKFVKKYPHGVKFMQGTKFTNVAFSSLSPGTVLPQHYGPTNIRIRCQLPLKYETGTQWIHSGLNKKQFYSGSTTIYFDDSCLHSAVNYGKEERVVLIFDVWHPNLSKVNREFLQQIFSCDE